MTERLKMCFAFLFSRSLRPLRRATQPIHAALDPVRVAASTGLLGVDFQKDIDRVDIEDDIRALKMVKKCGVIFETHLKITFPRNSIQGHE